MKNNTCNCQGFSLFCSSDSRHPSLLAFCRIHLLSNTLHLTTDVPASLVKLCPQIIFINLIKCNGTRYHKCKWE